MRTDPIADAVRLLAAVGAVAADPSLLSALKSAPSAYDALKKIAGSPPSSVGRLAETLAAQARELFQATPERPADADVLYADMVEVGMVGAPEIVAQGMNAVAVTEAMLAKLTYFEHRTPAMQGLFRNLTVPVLTRLLADKGFAADLTPAFMQGVLGRLDGLAAELDRLNALPRSQMMVLAYRFEIEGIPALSDEGLHQALGKRAEDWRAYRDRFEAIDERVAGLGNLKAAARDAAARLDFEEVERILARVDAVETEVAAETKLLRADNALLRGRVEEAFACLSAAPDGFARIDPTEPARRRLTYSDRLREYGRRYGRMAALGSAERMIRRALEDIPDALASEVWAEAQIRLGDALWEQGRRTDGRAGWDLIGEARQAYVTALRAYTKGDHPLRWAMLQRKLGSVHWDQGQRLGRHVAAQGWIGRAKVHFDAALQIYSERAHPVEWARTQTDLGIAWAGSDETGAKLAAAHYRKALRVFSEVDHPADWARTQYHLGLALALQALSGEAASAFRAALRAYSAREQPVDWAMAMENLGLTLATEACYPATAEARADLEEAARCFQAALRVYDPEHMPERHAGVDAALALVRARLRELGGESA